MYVLWEVVLGITGNQKERAVALKGTGALWMAEVSGGGPKANEGRERGTRS